MKPTRVNCAVVGLVQGLEDVYISLLHPRMRLVAVCDLDESKHRWLTGRDRIEEAKDGLANSPLHARWLKVIPELPGARDVAYVADYDQLLGHQEVAAVILVVPDPLHERFSVAALEAGKYVLCTKPMGVTMEAALNIARTASKYAGHYMLGFQMPYSPFASAVLGVIESGEVGAVRQIRFDYHRQPWRPAHSFKNTPVDGAVIKEGVHWLDMINRLDGQRPFRSVSGFGAIDKNGATTNFEDNGVVIIDYEGFRAAHTFSYFRKSQPMEDFLLVGERGTIRGTFERLQVESDAGVRTIEIPGLRYPYQHHVGYAEMHDEFAAMVLDGKEPYSNWETGLENMLLAHAAQVAVAECRTVERDELASLDWRLVLGPTARN
jgi:predicted dehydrogenase